MEDEWLTSTRVGLSADGIDDEQTVRWVEALNGVGSSGNVADLVEAALARDGGGGVSFLAALVPNPPPQVVSRVTAGGADQFRAGILAVAGVVRGRSPQRPQGRNFRVQLQNRPGGIRWVDNPGFLGVFVGAGANAFGTEEELATQIAALESDPRPED